MVLQYHTVDRARLTLTAAYKHAAVREFVFVGEMAEPLQVEVAVRIRPPLLPPSSATAAAGTTRPLSTVALRGSFGSYPVDQVHEEASSQEAVFEASVLPAVNSFLQVSISSALHRTMLS